MQSMPESRDCIMKVDFLSMKEENSSMCGYQQLLVEGPIQLIATRKDDKVGEHKQINSYYNLVLRLGKLHVCTQIYVH